MRRSAGLPALAAGMLAAATVGLVAHAQSGTGASPCSPPGGLVATTARSTMGLLVGPVETMYTRGQASSRHPTSGEIMLGGAGMSNPAGMSGPGGTGTTGSSTPGGGMPGPGSKDVRHLEVHICARDTGRVTQDASPTITVVDQTARGMVETVPVAVMEGVGQGAADLHYGNNVTMPSDHTFLVTVALGADRAAYTLTMGPEGMVWGEPTRAAAVGAPAPGAAAPPPPAAAAPAAPPMGRGSGPAAPPVMPPATGTRAPMPGTGVLSSAAPALGGGIACLGAALWLVTRRRRPQPVTVSRGGASAVRLGPRR
jgi:hypothetical protein